MANKVTLVDFESSVADPLLSDNFKVEIPLPREVSMDAKPLQIQIKSAPLPGSQLEQQIAEAFGHTTRHAGRRTFSGTWSVGYQESDDLKIKKRIEKWFDLTRKVETQTGGKKEDYAVKVLYHILNNRDEIVASYVIHGVWPTQEPELGMEQSGQALEVQVEFSFDHITVKE
tara:strand:- start:4642 stop:5157 length:516 start_codon:yes stop_codon:yes gene_type:complete